MKRIYSVGIIGGGVFAAVLCVLQPSSSRAPEVASFSGTTNGMVGAIAPTFSTLSSNCAASISRWINGGTNAALFTITNQQVCSIWVSPFVYICSGAMQSSREMMPLLDAPTCSGIKLAPGQIVTVRVASVAVETPWRAEFYYTRDSCSDSLRNKIRMIPEELRALTTRTPVRVESHVIRSEVVDK